MKDFIKWLGVNEKIAKVVVWLFIIMIMLITINTALDSIGFPHYQITYENLKQINAVKAIRVCASLLVCFLNFYVIVLLVFRVKETKNIFKYALLYVILNWIITKAFNYAILQAFIISFILLFCYLYSQKNKKYILLGVLSIGLNMAVQGITYLYKMKLIDFSKVTTITRALFSIDYFIIMAIIILVKEIYLKKRSEKICGMDQEAYCGLENLKKKTKSQKNLQRKSQAQSNKKKKK
jgi:hypothetical protein